MDEPPSAGIRVQRQEVEENAGKMGRRVPWLDRKSQRCKPKRFAAPPSHNADSVMRVRLYKVQGLAAPTSFPPAVTIPVLFRPRVLWRSLLPLHRHSSGAITPFANHAIRRRANIITAAPTVTPPLNPMPIERRYPPYTPRVPDIDTTVTTYARQMSFAA